MKLHIIIIFSVVLFNGLSTTSFSQSIENEGNGISVVSRAPVSYRVNDGKKLHGYYKKGYSLTIYGDSNAVGFRADCDEDDDWSGAKAGGTTQSKNSFETKFHCVFNPHTLYGTVLPGNASGQNHFDGAKKLGVGIGDLTITYKLDQHGNAVDSVIGVVFDRGPHNQPGESSVATRSKFKGNTDNNQFIYIIFPNSLKYLKQIVGTKANSNTLKRDPTNSDFEQAYKLMWDLSPTNIRKSAKDILLTSLSRIALVTNFDNATSQEKAKGKLKPGNDNRNLNE